MPTIVKQPRNPSTIPAKPQSVPAPRQIAGFGVDLSRFLEPSDRAIRDRLNQLHNPPGE